MRYYILLIIVAACLAGCESASYTTPELSPPAQFARGNHTERMRPMRYDDGRQAPAEAVATHRP